MLGYYNYTVILTYISLCISVVGIHFAMSGKPVFAFICLMTSGFCDMLDGPIARTKARNDEEKEFGIQIDSLTDLVCFGVFPAVIAYSLGMKNSFSVLILLLYVLCAMIRLAYFNVQESSRQKQTTDKRKYYSGMPVTTSAIIFPLVFAFKDYLGTYFIQIYGAIVIIVAMLFVLDIRIRKAGKKGLGVMVIIALIEFILLMRLI